MTGVRAGAKPKFMIRRKTYAGGKRKKYTAEEFFEITPESNSERYELMNGKITSLAAPNITHQRIVTKIASKFDNHISNKKGKCETFVSPIDVKFDDHNVVQPDVIVVCDPNKLNNGKRCIGAPDLVIEVTSTNRSRDYVDKLPLYKYSGVREYWIVDTCRERALVYNWDEDDQPNIYTFDQEIPAGIFNNELKIKIGRVCS